MKKFLSLAVFSLLALSSCKTDEPTDITLTPEQQLVGTWKISKYVEVNGADNSVIASMDADNCTKTSTYQFTGDKKLHFKVYAESGGTCSVQGEMTGYYNYDSPTKILSLYYASNTSDYLQLVSLNTNEMVILGDVADYNGDGMNDKTHIYFTK